MSDPMTERCLWGFVFYVAWPLQLYIRVVHIYLPSILVSGSTCVPMGSGSMDDYHTADIIGVRQPPLSIDISPL